MTNDVDTLATALYATVDDMLKEHPDLPVAPAGRHRCEASTGSWPPPRCGATTYGSWTPPRWNAAAPARPSHAPDLAGRAEYGYCASHSRFFWGLRLHLVCALQGLPIAFALTGAEVDERETVLDLLAANAELLRERPRQTLIGDQNYFGCGFERELSENGTEGAHPEVS